MNPGRHSFVVLPWAGVNQTFGLVLALSGTRRVVVRTFLHPEGCSANEKATSRRATYLLAIAAADNKHSDAETGDGHGGGFRNDIAVDADPEAFVGITKRAE